MALDIIFAIIFCWAIYKGYTRGFILQAATLAALILGIYGAIKFSGFTANFITTGRIQRYRYVKPERGLRV